MILPNDLSAAISAAYDSVRTDPQHDLVLGRRQAIYLAFGPSAPSLPTRRSTSHARRFHLARYAIERVLPYWERLLPDDDSPNEVLRIALSAFRGDIPDVEARALWGNYWVHFDNVSCNRPDAIKCVTVGYGAVQVLGVAIRDPVLDIQALDSAVTDKEVDPENLDSAFCAAAAYAFGPVWDAGSRSDLRMEFWRWWLEKAVPLAWLSENVGERSNQKESDQLE